MGIIDYEDLQIITTIVINILTGGESVYCQWLYRQENLMVYLCWIVSLSGLRM